VVKVLTIPPGRLANCVVLEFRPAGFFENCALCSSTRTIAAPGHARGKLNPMVTIDDVRELALQLPRSYEALVRDRVKFRVGRIVYLAFSRDETVMGFGFPKEERDALVASEPGKFLMPGKSDLRYNWVAVRLAAIDLTEMRDLVVEAWCMVVPKSVSAAYLGAAPTT